MASKGVFMFVKFLFVFVYNGMIPTVAQVVIDTDQPSPLVFYIFIVMMFVPEFTITISKKFRTWMKQGIEDGDGKLHREDIKDLRIHYSALWMLRMFVLFGLLMVFYQVQIPWQFYIMPFFGSMGLEGFALYKSLHSTFKPK